MKKLTTTLCALAAAACAAAAPLPQPGFADAGAVTNIVFAASPMPGASFKCIEPLRKLVSMRQMPDGRFYNPSRLVMGTNAVLQVGVNGDFDATNVRWRVVSGPATVSPASGFTTTVTPTGTGKYGSVPADSWTIGG